MEHLELLNFIINELPCTYSGLAPPILKYIVFLLKNFLLINFRKLMPNNVENNAAIIKNPENRKHYFFDE